MGQVKRQILWDTERGRAIRSVVRHGTVSLRGIFQGVSSGDIVEVSLSPCVVDKGQVTSSDVVEATASLSLTRCDGLPAPAETWTVGDGTNTGPERIFSDAVPYLMEREINALPLVSAAGGARVSQVGDGHYQVAAKQTDTAYTLTASGAAVASSVRAGAAGVQQLDSLVFRPSPSATATLATALDPPAVVVGVAEAGTPSKSQIDEVSLNGDFECGTFRLAFTAGTTEPVPFNAAAGQLRTAINTVLTPETVRVHQHGAGIYRYAYNSLGIQTPPSGDPEGLIELQGRKGTLDLSTFDAGRSGYEFLLECTVGTTAPETLFSEKVFIGPAR